jgi:hypothetical protein
MSGRRPAVPGDSRLETEGSIKRLHTHRTLELVQVQLKRK